MIGFRLANRFSAISWIFGAILLVVSSFTPEPAAAHPLDRLKQELVVEIAPDRVTLTVALGGGMLANEVVLSDLDPDMDRVVSAMEQARWVNQFLANFSVTIDQKSQTIEADRVVLGIPDLDGFHLGLQPLVVTVNVSLADRMPNSKHLLVVENRYRVDRSDHIFSVGSDDGIRLLSQGWPSSMTKISFVNDPNATGSAGGTDASRIAGWSAGSIIERAANLLERRKTPAFVLAMLGAFALMGAFHALQPGHGKAVVASYLVATRGTAKDAVMLASILTFSHTAGVFALGAATVAASEIFLPSHVIPVMQVASGLLVAALGASMLFRALRSRRAHAPASGVTLDAGQSEHHHQGDLSDEDHARWHAQEALAIRERVSIRSLLALGLAGGIAPCPEALAILLLAIGIHEAFFGMLAIVAFSLGLAAVLVGFGLTFALIRPTWHRFRATRAGKTMLVSSFGTLAARVAVFTQLLPRSSCWHSVC
jgi:nickel/cobalt exporter